MAIRHPENTIFKFHSTPELMWLPVLWLLHHLVSPKKVDSKRNDKDIFYIYCLCLSVCVQPSFKKIKKSARFVNKNPPTLYNSQQSRHENNSEAMSVLCFRWQHVCSVQRYYCYKKVLEMSNFCALFAA